MVDISLNLKKTAAIQEIDGSALIRLIDYCDENESWPGCGHEYKHIGGHMGIVINSSECSGIELKSNFFSGPNVARIKRCRC